MTGLDEMVKLSITAYTKFSSRKGEIIGKVTFQKVCQGEAPSTSHTSSSELEMDCMPPTNRRI